MAERILVTILERDEYAWISLSDGASTQYGSAAALGAAAAGREVVALIPGTDTLLTCARVPSNAETVIDKAVPYAIEERLADEPEALVFAHAPACDPMTRDIAVASAAVVDGIVEAIEKAGVTVLYAVPELILLPDDEPGWSILLRDEVALVRTGKRAGFAIEATALDALLQIEPDDVPPAVCIYATRAASLRLDMLSGVCVRHVEVADRLAPLAAAAAREDGVNFLRGRRRSGNAKRLRSIVATAAVVLIALVAYGGIGLLELRQIGSRVAAHRQEQLQTFSRAFPDVKRVVNIRVQADQKLAHLRNARREGFDFLDAIYWAGLHATTDDGGVEFHSVSYRDGALNVQVRGHSASAIESYRNMLAADDLSAELIAAESGRAHVMGRLRIAKQRP